MCEMPQLTTQYSPVDNSPIQAADGSGKSVNWSYMDRAGKPDDQVTPTDSSSDLKQAHQTINEVQPAHNKTAFIWWLEAGCCVLLVGGLVGIIATIARTDGKPLSQWPLQISVNTLIAAFSVLIKASCALVLAEGISHIKWTSLREPQSLHRFQAHDLASRGPWGAAVLLRNDLGRSVASLGAFITILILFLEPFSQQIVSLVDCEQIYADKMGAIPRINLYRLQSGFTAGATISLPWDLRNAVNQGIYATNKPQLEWDCDTGNCTFPREYSSVAFCHTCQDVSSELVSKPWPNPMNFSADEIPSFAKYPNMTYKGLVLQLDGGTGSVEEARHMLVARGEPTIDVIRVLDWQKPNYAAYSCEVKPCVKTYSGTIQNSQLKEEVKDEHMFSRNPSNGYYRAADLRCLNATSRQDLQNMGHNITSDDRWTTWHVAVERNETTQQIQYKGTCEYVPEQHVDQYCDKTRKNKSGKHVLLKDEYAQLFPASCVYTMNPQMGEALNANTFAELFKGEVTEHYSFASPAQFGPEALLAVWNAGSGNGTLDDFTGLIKNISDAVTTHIRLNGEDYQSDFAHGEVHYNTVCIEVHWPWVAYSGVVVGLTLLFFTWVVLQARQDQALLHKRWAEEGVENTYHDFKSGALTVLFHGLDDSSRRKLADAGSTNRQRELPTISKDMKVQLVPTQSGWKLSTADS